MKTYTQEVKDYAGAIHRLTCNGNHTDYCGWTYGEGQRQYDYEAAEKLLGKLKDVASPDTLHNLADVIRPWTIDWRKW